jgi:hypothetical protein
MGTVPLSSLLIQSVAVPLWVKQEIEIRSLNCFIVSCAVGAKS